MVQNVKCQLVKSSKHKHENGVKLNRLPLNPLVCVCVCASVRLWLWPGICRSGGCLQRTEVRPQEILPHAWCAPTAALTGERDECVKLLYVSTSDVMITAEPRVCSAATVVARAARPAASHSHRKRREILSWVWLVIKVQQDRVEEVCSHRNEDMNNCQRTLKHREPTSTITNKTNISRAIKNILKYVLNWKVIYALKSQNKHSGVLSWQTLGVTVTVTWSIKALLLIRVNVYGTLGWVRKEWVIEKRRTEAKREREERHCPTLRDAAGS